MLHLIEGGKSGAKRLDNYQLVARFTTSDQIIETWFCDRNFILARASRVSEEDYPGRSIQVRMTPPMSTWAKDVKNTPRVIAEYHNGDPIEVSAL